MESDERGDGGRLRKSLTFWRRCILTSLFKWLTIGGESKHTAGPRRWIESFGEIQRTFFLPSCLPLPLFEG